MKLLAWLSQCFCAHDWEGVPGTWRRCGETLNWCLHIVPEYERVEQCKECQATRRQRYISAADCTPQRRQEHRDGQEKD